MSLLSIKMSASLYLLLLLTLYKTVNSVEDFNNFLTANQGEIDLPNPLKNCSWSIPPNKYITLLQDEAYPFTCDDVILSIRSRFVEDINYCSWNHRKVIKEWWIPWSGNISLVVKSGIEASIPDVKLIYGPTKLGGFCSGFDRQCADLSGCYNTSDMCDYKNDCSNGEDEQNCIKYCRNKYKCKSEDKCYSRLDICDGVRHCNSSADEENCGRLYCKNIIYDEGLILCNDGSCVAKTSGPFACPDAVGKRKIGSFMLYGFLIFCFIIIFFIILLRWMAWRASGGDLTPPEFSPRPFISPQSDTDSAEISPDDFRNGSIIFESAFRARQENNHREQQETLDEEQVELDLGQVLPSRFDRFSGESRIAPVLALASLGIAPAECDQIAQDLLPQPSRIRLVSSCETERGHRRSRPKMDSKRPFSDSVVELKK